MTYLKGEAAANRAAYRMGKGLDRVYTGMTDATKARIDATVVDSVAMLQGRPRSPEETRAAYELTDSQARDWIASNDVFAGVTVEQVLADNRLRIMAARLALKLKGDE
jgi:hypothetical protein